LRIVILDGYCLNHGDLSWDGFFELGSVQYYDRTAQEDIVQRSIDADIIITNKCRITKEIIDRLPKLRYIGVLATGFDVIDIEYAKKKNIVVTNIPTYGTDSVVQMVFALLLELYASLSYHLKTVKQGEWSRCPDYCYYKDGGLKELSGKIMGIVGYGNIGAGVGRVAQAFGMKVIALDKVKSHKETSTFRYVDSLEELLKSSDVVSLNCPLTSENRKMINRDTLAMMKSSAVLINTARGPLVDEEALAEALNKGIIAGAGLDVLEKEPPQSDSPIFKAKNVAITPHISWATFEARSRLMDIAVDNLASFLKGSPVNVVNV
jgi:glycerate dehydrogenase